MNNAMRRIRTIHFVGIGGVGMAGIAEVLINLGYDVQGSDLVDNAVTQRLQRMGAVTFIGHQRDNLGSADVVVVSSAVSPENEEVVAAHERRIPVVQRAEMLAELMRFRFGIAVAGTHGKTTTTSLVSSVLAEGGLDPTFVIGGRLASADSNARLGGGEYLVAEADESDASFLHLQPMISVVTNIDADHLQSYGNSVEQLRQGFVEFLHNLPFYGLAVLCVDDPQLRELAPVLGRAVLSYGFDESADVRAVKVEGDGLRSRFDVIAPGVASFEVVVNLPGRHNVQNALAAIAVGVELGVDPQAIGRALADFEGIDRRFELLGTVATDAGVVTFVDDYGHHPTEIDATIRAARDAWPGRRLVVVFQPHRYTRTRELMDDFVQVLSGVDALVLTEVYSAGEEPIAGADGRAIARAVRARGAVDPVFVGSESEVPDALTGLLHNQDIVLTLGAGSIGALARRLPTLLAVKGPVEVRS